MSTPAPERPDKSAVLYVTTLIVNKETMSTSWLRLKCVGNVAFEPISKVTRCHYDALNNIVFSVRSGGVTGLLGRSLHSDRNVNLRLDEALDITAIKMSKDRLVLAIRLRDEDGVMCVDVDNERSANNDLRLIEGTSFFKQQCRPRAKLIQFAWTPSNELVFFTTQGVELYNVNRRRRLIRSLRNHNQTLNWVVFNPCACVAVTSGQEEVQNVSELSLLVIRDNYVVKAGKLSGPNQKGATKTIRERDITILMKPGDSYKMATKNVASIFVGVTTRIDQNLELHLHFFTMDLSSIQWTHVLHLDPFSSLSNVGLSLVDDLVVVHQINSDALVFDLASEQKEEQHAFQPTQIRPIGAAIIEEENTESTSKSAKTWLAFQPDIMVDALSGMMYSLKLVLTADIEMRSQAKLVHFLQRRASSKALLLIKLRTCLEQASVSEIADVFDIVCSALKTRLMSQKEKKESDDRDAKACSLIALVKNKVVLDQSEIYASLLTPLMEQCDTKAKRQRLVALLMELFRSLHKHFMRPQHFLNELLINVFVQNEAYYQLHQVLQYQVIGDSKPLACLLLSLQNVYPFALQLALDMLARLKESNEEICEILLAQNLVIEALRVAIGSQNVEPRKFLEEAMRIGDDKCFHSVYAFLKAKKLLPEGKAEYAKYEKHYRDTFGVA